MTLRQKEIKIRVSDAEYLALQRRNTKARLAEWMRIVCLGEKEASRFKAPPCDPALLRQLASIGNNLNQIARATNSDNWKAVDRIKVISALSSIEQAIQDLKDSYS